jgi:hypothetical protein
MRDTGSSSHLTLTGKVEWLYQKESAEIAVRHIRGVRGVLNHITVAPRTPIRGVRHHSAERAAANSPGIAYVDNRIVVQSSHDAKMDAWDEIC